jgi:hypothetical protein
LDPKSEQFKIHLQGHFTFESWVFDEKVYENLRASGYLIHRSKFPACLMNAGYLAGWVYECFGKFHMNILSSNPNKYSLGIEVVVCEVTCKAKGEDYCEIILTTEENLRQEVEELFKHKQKIENLHIPCFWSSQRYLFPSNPLYEYSNANLSERRKIKEKKERLHHKFSGTLRAKENSESLAAPEVDTKNADLFGQLQCTPVQAFVRFKGRLDERYIFCRSASLSVDFFTFFQEKFPPEQEVRKGL